MIIRFVLPNTSHTTLYTYSNCISTSYVLFTDKNWSHFQNMYTNEVTIILSLNLSTLAQLISKVFYITQVSGYP